MKPQFAKKNKNKAKAKKAKKSKAAAAGQDVDMAEHKEDVEEIDYTMPEGGSAKQRLKGKLELKTALKAKVKQLKHSRNKLTKLQGGAGAVVAKQGAKLLNKELKSLVKKKAGAKQTKSAKPEEGMQA